MQDPYSRRCPPNLDEQTPIFRSRWSRSLVTKVTFRPVPRSRWTLFVAAVPFGDQCKRDSRIRVQFLHDPAHVVFDRAFGEVHGFGDLPVAQALRYQLQDSLFLVIEYLDTTLTR